MFGKRFKILQLAGFSVFVDASWFLILLLVVWSLAVGWFPQALPDQAPATYWWMAVVGALIFFASIVTHELAHSLVARRYGIPIRSITLFVLGGVAEMGEEPPDPKSEFLMAGAGPLTSLLLAAVAYALAFAFTSTAWQGGPAWSAIFGYLAVVNLIVAIFNLIPAFPLDGGRMLRAMLWRWKGQLRWATRVTSQIGASFGTLLIVAAVVALFLGWFISAMWWFLIGMFLRSAARGSYQQLMLRESLQGMPVHRFMQPEVVTVPPDLTLRQLVDDYVYRYYFKMFPIVDGGRLVGCITTNDVKRVPSSEWERTSVADATHCDPAVYSIHSDVDAVQALARMNRHGISRLMVVEDSGRLRGVLALKDLLRFLALRIELEEEGQSAVAAPSERGGDAPLWTEQHA